jgi:hypothetical protein
MLPLNPMESGLCIFDGHGQVLTKGLSNTRRFALGAIFVYQLVLWYRFEHGLGICELA